MNRLTQDQYQTVSGKMSSNEIKIKGSRFIGTIKSVKSKTAAEKFYKEIKNKYHDASHNCFAYIINEKEFRYSDDGEPSGTAGLPIYNVIKNNNMSEIIVIITRYFGGTKLGTGGLARAYTETTIDLINKALKVIKTYYVTFKVKIKYENYNNLLKLIHQYGGEQGEASFAEKVDLEIKIPKSRFGPFKNEYETKFYNA